MTPAEYDARYDTDCGRWIGDTEYRLLTGLLTPQFGDQVLEVGCGTGWFTRRMSRLAGVEVTGIFIDVGGGLGFHTTYAYMVFSCCWSGCLSLQRSLGVAVRSNSQSSLYWGSTYLITGLH